MAVLAAALGTSLLICASALAKMPQTITFTSTSSQAVAGGSYEVSATSSSGLPVSLYASEGCSFVKPVPNREVRRPEEHLGRSQYEAPEGPVAAPAVVYFVAATKCFLEARVQGTSEYEPAITHREVAVGIDPSEQITFISTPPSHAVVGERSYEPTVLSSAGIDVFLYSTTRSCGLGGAS